MFIAVCLACCCGDKTNGELDVQTRAIVGVMINISFGATIGTKWYIWNLDTTKSTLPDQQGNANPEGQAKFR